MARPVLSVYLLVALFGHCWAAPSLDTTRWFAGYCLPEKDAAMGSGLEWPKTPVNVIINLPCPPGATGEASRECGEDGQSPTKGRWKSPDVTKCTNEKFYTFWKEVRSLLQNKAPPATYIIQVLELMDEMMNEASDNHTLYPHDLTESTQFMEDVAITLQGFKYIHFKIDKLASTYGNALSTILSNKTKHVWQTFKEPGEVISMASNILQAMENFAMNLLNTKLDLPANPAEGMVRWSRLHVVAENLDFEVYIADNVNNETSNFTLEADDHRTSVTFPREVADIALENNKPEVSYFGFYRAQFYTMQDLLMTDPIPSQGCVAGNSSKIMTSLLLSAKVLGFGIDEETFSKLYSNLESPIVITFRHEDGLSGKRGECSFLRYDVESPADRWSTDGCVASEFNDSHTTCHCYHMSNFALLMDLFKMRLGVDHERALSCISYIGGTLSIIGCLLSICTYEYFRLSSERIRIHQMLALSIILSQLIFFIGFGLTQNVHVCRIFSVLLHYALTVMFCWMLVEGVHLYISLVKVFAANSHFKKYVFTAWGLPMVNVGVCAAVFPQEYGNAKSCWISDRLLLVAFVPFVVTTIVSNTVIFVMVLRVMFKSLKSDTRTRPEEIPSARTGLKATIILLPLLGLTWSFGFLSINSSDTLVFTYMFTICNSLQGVFFFIFHCLRNIEVRRAYKRRKMQKKMANSSHQKPIEAKKPCPAIAETERVVEGESVKISCRKRASAFSTASNETNTTSLDENDPGEKSGSDVGSLSEASLPERHDSVRSSDGEVRNCFGCHSPNVGENAEAKLCNECDKAKKNCANIISKYGIETLDVDQDEAENKNTGEAGVKEALAAMDSIFWHNPNYAQVGDNYITYM